MKIIKFPFGPFETNALLVIGEKTGKAAAFDPSAGSSGAILDRAKGFTIDKILLTHSHWDHIADVAELKRKTGAPIYVHPLDAANVERPGSDGLRLIIPIEGVKPDFLLEEGQKIHVGEIVFEVIHTPGHCPGSVCFYSEKEGLLISGDTLFQGAIGSLSLPTAEPEKMWGSLAKLAKLPGQTRVVPGHGNDTTIAKEGRFLCH